MPSLQRLYATLPLRFLAVGNKIGTSHSKVLQITKMDFSTEQPTFSKFRSWKRLADADSPKDEYKLMSYNILSQELLLDHMQLYVDIDASLLKWSTRLRNISAEINALKPDILCLQEMHSDHLDDLLKAISSDRRYKCIYKKKTDDRHDGCAIIYDVAKFRMLQEYPVEYYMSPVGSLNRHNVGLIAKFCTEPRSAEEKSKTFLVATTHLLYNPRRQDVRVAQLDYMLRELERISIVDERTQTQQAHKTRLPIILTGDFNFQHFSEPYDLVIDGKLDYNFCNNDVNEELSTKLKHCLHLKSAYDAHGGSTFQNRWIIVDFIFYCRCIKIWSRYQLPNLEDCRKMGKIPNETLGSDHLCLAVTFSIEKAVASNSATTAK